MATFGTEKVKIMNHTMHIQSLFGSCHAQWADADTVKMMFRERFNGCRCHTAFPDQLHTFVGECSSMSLFVAMVPDGDVRFLSNRIGQENIVVVVGERVSADYLEYLQDMDISYIYGGKSGDDMELVLHTLRKDFGIDSLLISERSSLECQTAQIGQGNQVVTP